MSKEIPHIPVLLKEVCEVFGELNGGTIVDATLGYGGHSEALLAQNSSVKLFGIDRDIEAIELAFVMEISALLYRLFQATRSEFWLILAYRLCSLTNPLAASDLMEIASICEWILAQNYQRMMW